MSAAASVHAAATGTADYLAVAGAISAGRRFLLTGHRSPDGDTLGSALALAAGLRAAGKEAQVVMRDRWAPAYAFLPGIERVEVVERLPADWPAAWDAILVMECPHAARTGFPELTSSGIPPAPSGRDGATPAGFPPAPSGSGCVVNVDHHPGNDRYGAINLVDLAAAATGEIVADLFDLLEWPLTPQVATALWVSLVTDTGSFRFPNTTAKALALGARLVSAGAHPGEANEAIFESKSHAAVRLEAMVLATLELHHGGRVATLEAPAGLLESTGADRSDLEGMANKARSIAGVRAAAFLHEVDGVVRCSFRSKGGVDVRSVAARHGGGGHRNASGCDVEGSLAGAKALLVREMAEVADREAGA